jgi:hypothetical protein
MAGLRQRQNGCGDRRAGMNDGIEMGVVIIESSRSDRPIMLDVWLPLKGVKTFSADVTATSFDDPSAVAK